eukprot:6198468-Pleurochrysis_carterae.AAC.1
MATVSSCGGWPCNAAPCPTGSHRHSRWRRAKAKPCGEAESAVVSSFAGATRGRLPVIGHFVRLLRRCWHTAHGEKGGREGETAVSERETSQRSKPAAAAAVAASAGWCPAPASCSSLRNDRPLRDRTALGRRRSAATPLARLQNDTPPKVRQACAEAYRDETIV